MNEYGNMVSNHKPNRTKPVRAVGVDDPLWEAAKVRAASRGETVTDVINRALRRYVAAKTSETPRQTPNSPHPG